MTAFLCGLLLVLSLGSPSDAEGGTSDSWSDAFVAEMLALFNEGGVIYEVNTPDLTPDDAAKAYYDSIISVGAAGGPAFKDPIAQGAQIVSDQIKVCFACKTGEDLVSYDAAKVAWGLSAYTNVTQTADPKQKADEYGEMIVDTAAQTLTQDESSKILTCTAAFFQFLFANNAVTPDTTVKYAQYYADQCTPCSSSSEE